MNDIDALVDPKQNRFVLDPRTKILLLILVNVLMFSYGSSFYLYASVVFAAVLLLLANAFQAVLYMAVFYGILFALDFLIGFAPASILPVWSAISLSFFVFLPFFMFALLFFATTSIGEAAAGLQKLRLPHFILIPLLVMIRFLPTIRQEFRAITNAMRLRGAVGRGNPLKTLEYIYVPLLFSLVKTGEELTVAALTRGLGLHNQRTMLVEPKMRWFDFVVLAIMIFFIVGRRLELFL